MIRPVEIDKVFNLTIDAYTCLWGGLISPKLCLKELNEKIGETDFLVSMESSFSEDTHLSKSNYFNICSSNDRTKEVSNIACCMIAVFAFESLKINPKYDSIKNLEIIRFLGHLRNAAAHGNRFCFIDSITKKFKDPKGVTWRLKSIDKHLENKTAFPDFFPHGDFAYLFEDITMLLK